jgi:hypothetical protein
MGSVSRFDKFNGHALYSVERNRWLVSQSDVSPIYVFNNPRKRVSLLFCRFVVQVEGGEEAIRVRVNKVTNHRQIQAV